MRHMVGLVLIALLHPHATAAQGVAPETTETIAAAAPAPAFRGVLPPRADLSAGLPPARDQGWTESCVSWAATYYAASYAYAIRTGAATPAIAFSPGFTYGVVAGDPNCRTTTRISATLEVLRTVGTLPIEEFAFDGGWCGRRPIEAERVRVVARGGVGLGA